MSEVAQWIPEPFNLLEGDPFDFFCIRNESLRNRHQDMG